MSYKIQFPIGDHSGDGHGRCDTYVVESNLPVDKVVEVHKSCPKKLGFSIGSMACEYQEGTVSQGILDKLLETGLLLDEDVIYYTDGWIDPADMLDLWLSILKYLEPSLDFKVISNDMPSMANYVEVPGYGLYD